MAIKHNLVEFEGQKNITVVHDGEMYVADNNHPNWDRIMDAVENDRTEGLADLFDTEKAVNARFQKVSERVSVRNGAVLFDGDEVHNSLTNQIVRFLDEGVEDWKPLVAFMEKVYTNPQEYSRNQLFDFLANNAFTITDEGDIIGYKGMNYSESEDVYRSWHEGTAFVNGEKIVGKIVQRIGDTVEMPRSEVTFDPNTGCSFGLHVSNYQYATSYGNRVLTVVVNPRDVVSVPREHSWQKVRVCRYTVIEPVDGSEASPLYVAKHAAPTVSDYDPDEENEDDWLEDDYLDDDSESWDSWDDDYEDDEDDLDDDNEDSAEDASKGAIGIVSLDEAFKSLFGTNWPFRSQD